MNLMKPCCLHTRKTKRKRNKKDCTYQSKKTSIKLFIFLLLKEYNGAILSRDKNDESYNIFENRRYSEGFPLA